MTNQAEIPFTDLEVIRPSKNGKSAGKNIDNAITQAVDIINGNKSEGMIMTHSKNVIEENGNHWFWQKPKRYRIIKVEIILTEEI